MCPVLLLAQHGTSNLDATVNRLEKTLTKLIANKLGFLSGEDMGKQWACVPKCGRSLALRELRRRSRPP